MDLHRVGALLDAGADARERLGLLVDHGLDEIFPQRRRDGEPADAGADDRDGELLLVAHELLRACIPKRENRLS